MRCKVCGNTRHFLTEVKEFRIVDVENPEELSSFVIPIVANCMGGPNCTATSKEGNIEFDNIPSPLISMAVQITSYRNG